MRAQVQHKEDRINDPVAEDILMELKTRIPFEYSSKQYQVKVSLEGYVLSRTYPPKDDNQFTFAENIPSSYDWNLQKYPSERARSKVFLHLEIKCAMLH